MDNVWMGRFIRAFAVIWLCGLVGMAVGATIATYQDHQDCRSRGGTPEKGACWGSLQR